MGNDNVIEFNGKRYDAITGKLLGKSHAEVVEPLAPPSRNRRNIDGVVRQKASLHESPRQITSAKTVKPAIHPKSAVRQAAKILKPHRPQSAKTLMRRAVHKPATMPKPAIKTQTPAEVMAKPISAIAIKHSVHHVDPIRKHRASQIPKSRAVRRFAPPTERQRHVAVRPMPSKPVAQSAMRLQSTHHAKPDIFEAAIARANSHEQPKIEPHIRKRHKRRKMVSLAAGFAAFLVLSGFLTYLNMATIELKIASVNAGFSAERPSYNPTGYELADIKDQPGQITLSFRSGDRSYQLIQQPTNWNSQTLQDNIIASAGSKTIESKGRIIYIYDGVASWISGGVRYDLTGNANFSEKEIAAIAASM